MWAAPCAPAPKSLDKMRRVKRGSSVGGGGGEASGGSETNLPALEGLGPSAAGAGRRSRHSSEHVGPTTNAPGALESILLKPLPDVSLRQSWSASPARAASGVSPRAAPYDVLNERTQQSPRKLSHRGSYVTGGGDAFNDREDKEQTRWKNGGRMVAGVYQKKLDSGGDAMDASVVSGAQGNDKLLQSGKKKRNDVPVKFKDPAAMFGGRPGGRGGLGFRVQGGGGDSLLWGLYSCCAYQSFTNQRFLYRRLMTCPNALKP